MTARSRLPNRRALHEAQPPAAAITTVDQGTAQTTKRTKIATANTAPINQAYGELREDLHFTGYAFERGCHRLRKLLSDDSWKQCGGGFSNVDDFERACNWTSSPRSRRSGARLRS